MTLYLRTLLTCLVAFLPLRALAQEGLPAVGEPKSFSLPAVETYSLRNGTQVTLVDYGRVPKATVRAVVRAGNLNDGDMPWIADLTASMMREGAGDKDAAGLALAAAAMGGDLSVNVGLDQTTIGIDGLSESASEAVALIADVVQRPSLPEDAFGRVRDTMMRDLSVAASQPGTLAQAAFTELMYPDHPYSRAVLPDPDEFSALTLDDVKAYHAENFGAARTHIYVVGQFDRRAVKRAIRDEFRQWNRGPAPLDLVPGESADPQLVVIDRPGAVQSTIRFGQRVPAIDETMNMEATDTLLGGYFSSRITKNIREDKGYTYSPRSAVSSEVGAAYWSQNADVTTEITGAALQEIINEIATLQTTAPDDAELQGVKNYMNGIFVIRLASRGGIANQLAFVDLHDLGLDYLENFVDQVQSLTPADIQQSAQDQISLNQMSLVVVGDKDLVDPQLAEIENLKSYLSED